MNHFKELRTLIIKSFLFFFVIFIILFFFSNNIYLYLSKPFLEKLSFNKSLIAIDISSTFFVPLKLVIILSIIISMPYFIYNFWLFISPGLYFHEKKFLFPIVTISSILFYIGILFAFYFICPTILIFFEKCAPNGIKIMVDIANYMDFMLKIMISVGLSFQIPIVIFSIIHLNIISKDKISKNRPFFIILSFIIGMLMTPPDVVSQIMLAIPIWMLFEIGLLISKKK